LFFWWGYLRCVATLPRMWNMFVQIVIDCWVHISEIAVDVLHATLG
uniref:Uncharacterized protein n=1 Tax=Acrobeloides nanus TaxID=290746 RepID=A0A914DXD0_9BILA